MDDETKDKLGIPRHMKAEMWIMDFDMTENEMQAYADKKREELETKRRDEEYLRDNDEFNSHDK